ncbi:MAG: hypothetical protein Kow0059_06580 [Candidatus Sumerlaeia bacterium]
MLAPILIVWALAALATGAPDVGQSVRLHLKNGQAIEGRVVSEDDESVTIDTSLAEIPITRSRIERIEILAGAPAAGESQNAVDLHFQAQAAFSRQQYIEALRLAGESLKAGHPNPALPRLLVRQCADLLVRRMNEQLGQADHTAVITTGLKLLEQLGRPETSAAFETPEAVNRLAAETRALVAEGYLRRADASRLKDQLSLKPNIESDLESAIAYGGPTSETTARAYYLQALMLIAQNRPTEALPRLTKAYNISQDYTFRRQIQHHEEQLRRQLAGEQDAARIAREREQTAPADARPSAPQAAPVPPPQPPAQPSGPQKRWLNSIRGWFDQYAWTRSIWAYLAAFIEGGYWVWVLGAAGGYIVLWRVPRAFINRRMRRGDFKAAEWRQGVNRFGLLGLVPYFLSRRGPAQGQKEVARCPACRAGLEPIELYKNLKFDACPHCGQPIDPVFSLDDYIEKMVQSLDSLHLTHQPDALPAGQRVVIKDAMSKLVRGLITMAVQARATDLHIEPVGDHLKFRARVDGMLFEMRQMPVKLAPSVISSLKVMANLDITERRVPQDGSFNMWVDGVDIDIRVSTSPVAQGEAISLRLLDHRTVQMEPSQMGLEDENLARFNKAIHSPQGLILVTGPSGSGKSTTLYVALRLLNTGERNIITIEDPIEYKIKGLNQSQINPAADFNFATALRSLLRQDPDVIMVGEIRDRDTAQLAIDAALTGHLVFSTLHTMDSVSTFYRLTDLGCDPNRMALCVQCVIAQRLIRLICTGCIAPYTPPQSLLEELEMPLPSGELKYYKGQGCTRCNQSGYFGRTGLFEILLPTAQIRDAVEKRQPIVALREIAAGTGMRSLREEGILKIIQGKTTLEEILRVTT